MNLKKILAKNIVKQFHHEAAVLKAKAFFSNQFQNKTFDEKVFEPVSLNTIKSVNGSISILELCFQLKNSLSKSAIRKLIERGTVLINNKKIVDSQLMIKLKKETRIKVGKRDFFELK